MAVVAIPVRATLRDVLRDLLRTRVVVRQAHEQQLDEQRTSYLAVYDRADGTPVAAAVVDLAGALAMAGARAGVPAADAVDTTTGPSALEGELYESFAEVAGVLATTLNSPMTTPVGLDAVLAVPGPVPQAVADLVLAPSVRVDYAIEVEGRDPGTLTLLSR